MSFFLSNTPKSMSAEALPQTQLGELTALSRPSWFQRGRFTAGGEWRRGEGRTRGRGDGEGRGKGGRWEGIAPCLLGDRRSWQPVPLVCAWCKAYFCASNVLGCHVLKISRWKVGYPCRGKSVLLICAQYPQVLWHDWYVGWIICWVTGKASCVCKVQFCFSNSQKFAFWNLV